MWATDIWKLSHAENYCGWGTCSRVYARMLYCHDGANFTYFIRMNKATFDYPYGLEKIEQYFITQLLRYETVFGDASEGETIATTSRILASKEFQKHPLISSAFRLPKMHHVTRDKHVIKQTLLIDQTYWESYNIIQQISPNFSPISHMIWEIIACYDISDHMRNKSEMQPISYDFSARNRQEIIGFSAISVFSPLSDFLPISRQEIASVN